MVKKGFHSTPLTDSDIEAKPMVLLIGQYSTVKSTFVVFLLIITCIFKGQNYLYSISARQEVSR